MSHNQTAEKYFNLTGADGDTQNALLACSIALKLDDTVASKAIEKIVKSNGNTVKLLEKVKDFDCIWHHWDGSWYVSEDIRPIFLKMLIEQVSGNEIVELREILSEHFHEQAECISSDGQISLSRKRQFSFESAHQKLLTPEKTTEGAELFVKIWDEAQGAAQSIVESVDYLADEFDRYIEKAPVQILFFRGMAAHANKDKAGQLKYFKPVWKNGTYGKIYAIAACLYGNVCRDRAEAEEALRDSLKLFDDRYNHALVYHSLGNHLSKDRNRWKDAEAAFVKSIELDPNPEGKAQVYHSLGNLLSKDRNRWKDAEAAFVKSIELDPNPEQQAQVKASWADGLHKLYGFEFHEKIFELTKSAINLDPNNPHTCGVCNRILSDVYEEMGDIPKAIEHREALLKTDKKLGKQYYIDRTRKEIENLRKKL